MTSSPGPTPSADRVTSRAAVPLVTAMPCFAAWNLANSCSKASVRVPGVRHQMRLSSTSVRALRSASSYCGQMGNSFCFAFFPPFNASCAIGLSSPFLRTLKLIEACRVTKGFHVMAILAWLSGAQFFFRFRVILRVPIRAIFRDRGLELTYLLRHRVELQVRDL